MLFSDCITKDTPPPFNLPSTTFGYTPGETHLWTFVRVEGVEPTNNDAERALRHGVIDRKLSGGTASESGSRFVERMLSVVATCRQQDINVLDYRARSPL